MSTASKVDPSTLGWVKTEIDETLKQARLALESFAENPADEAQLRFCTTYLHQVVGTLQMVELDGAALLAREIESLTHAILDKKAPAEPGSFEVLVRAILALPDYLARLQFGLPDAPLRVLPLINDLRELRHAAPLPEADFFTPDLSVQPPGFADHTPLPAEEYCASLRKLRAAYQAALLTWLKDISGRQELNRMQEILEQLQREATALFTAQLFWIAGGFVSALACGDLEVSNDRKKLLGRIEQHIKRLSDGNEDEAQREATQALTKVLLLQLADAKQDMRAIEIKRVFDIDTLLGKSPAESGGHDLPTPEALVSVSQALGKEIENAQDLLAAYFDATREDVKNLSPLIGLLKKMSRTLEMLGVAPMQELVDALAETAQAIENGDIEASDAASMHLAGGLLLIENSAREIYQNGDAWKRQIDERISVLTNLRAGVAGASLEGFEISDAPLSETEFKQLLKVVSTEIRVNLNKIEEALEAFAGSPGDKRSIDAVPQYLSQIQGALEILGQRRSAELTIVTRRYIERIQAGSLIPDRAVFDALAIAVGTIEVYLEGLERDRPNLESLIDSALRELEDAIGCRTIGLEVSLLERIQQNLQLWLDDHQNERALADLGTDLATVIGQAQSQERDNIVTLAGEMVTLVQTVQDDPQQGTDEILDTLKTSSELLIALARDALAEIAPAAPPLKTASAKKNEAIEDLDEDIMQIFIEDAKEVSKNLERSLEAWHAEPHNRDALLELRRGYHTLKGSGRMVGAAEIAELAWSVESMLNQVREGKLPPSQPIFDLLYDVKAVLPDLIEQLESGRQPEADVEALGSRALALVGTNRGAHAPVSTPRRKAEIAEEASALDPTLLQIFTAEASGHLATIKSFVEAGPGVPVAHTLLRAAHTLQGNARSLKLGPMAQACAELEKLLHAQEVRQRPLDNKVLGLLLQVHSRVADLLANLNAGAGLSKELAQSFTSLAQAFAHEHEKLDVGLDFPQADISESVLGLDIEELQGTALLDVVSVSEEPRAPAVAMPQPEEELPEEIDPELLDIFREEAADILEQIEEALTQWRGNRAATGAIPGLKRSLHTLKGGARMAGAMAMGNLSHNTESLLKQVEEGRIEASNELLDLLDEVHDMLVLMLERVTHERPAFVPEVRVLNQKVLTLLEGGAVPAYIEQRDATTRRSVSAPVPTLPVSVADRSRSGRVEEAEDEEAEPGSLFESKAREHIKVRTRLLNELVNHAGEVSIARSRMEQQIFGLREHLSELSRNVTRFREQIRELEIQSESQILYRAGDGLASAHQDFDPLEFDRFSRLQHLSRGLAESLHDLSAIQSTLDNFVGEAETALQQQARVNTDLQEGLMRTRMINFSTQAARLRHIARQTSRELGKRAELNILGTEVEVDRNVLDRMIGPFEHMIRNAIDHGIENEAERIRLGKSAVGTITIQTSHEGSEIVVRFSDDGAGLNVKAIRNKAIERGLMKPDANLSEEEIMQFILLPGFSTAQKITHVSGRGVGMDVVHSEVKQLGGSITVETQSGTGTTFTVRLPLTLSVTQALMVRAGEQIFAIPISAISNILDVPRERVNNLSMGEKPLFNHEDQVYPFLHLPMRLGLIAVGHGQGETRKVPVLIARTGTREIAIQIDGLAGTREVVIKSLGQQLSEIKGLAGATILGDGKVVLILDVAGLWLTEDSMQFIRSQAPAQAIEQERRRPTVMVVDDSLTVRKVTSRHLQKRGYDVLVAKDGLDAWEQLRGEHVPDVMLVDIEMPRMDGYELTSNVRSDSNLKHVPIIMITSRAGAKHRDRALALGVNLYMSKPYQEDELTRNIESLLPALRLQ